jgi:predicted TIM-barrel fold metal-dependent hydrolase
MNVTLDIDVLLGAYPDRDGPPGDLPSLRAALGATTGAVASLRAALYDVRTGNDEVLAAAGPSLVPVGGLDLRDPLGAERELDRLADAGVRAVRVFPEEQLLEPDFPSVGLVARRAAAFGLTVLIGGDVRRFWRPFAGLGSTVVFLDAHYQHVGDFLVAARDEPGFHISTRLLNSPDAVELVAEHAGAGRLLFGSRTPFEETAVPRLRLARSGLTPDQVAAVAGGTARRLLGLPR